MSKLRHGLLAILCPETEREQIQFAKNKILLSLFSKGDSDARRYSEVVKNSIIYFTVLQNSWYSSIASSISFILIEGLRYPSTVYTKCTTSLGRETPLN